MNSRFQYFNQNFGYHILNSVMKSHCPSSNFIDKIAVSISELEFPFPNTNLDNEITFSICETEFQCPNRYFSNKITI